MININLIAERRARKIREMTVIRSATLGVIALMMILLACNVFVWAQGNQLSGAVNEVRGKLDDLADERTELKEIKDEIAEKEPVVHLLRQVRVSEAAWMTIFGDLSQMTSNDVVLTAFATLPSRTGIELRITGEAKDQDTVGSFMLAFEQDTDWAQIPALGSVNSQDNQDIGKRVRFNITVPVKDLLGGDL